MQAPRPQQPKPQGPQGPCCSCCCQVSFALKSFELVQLIDEETLATKAVELYHDPNKGSSEVGGCMVSTACQQDNSD